MNRTGRASLPRVLWRFRHGRCAEDHLRRTIRGRLALLARRVRDLEGHAERLRRIHGDRWKAQDKARRDALRALGWRRFEDCVRSLRTAERELELLGEAVRSTEELNRAERAFRAAMDELDLTDLSAMPTLRIPDRCAAAARERLESGEPHQARAAIRMLVLSSAVLRPGTGAGGEEADGPPEAEPAVFVVENPVMRERLEALWRGGRRELAARLSDDLEAHLPPSAPETSSVPPTAPSDLARRAHRIARRIETLCDRIGNAKEE